VPSNRELENQHLDEEIRSIYYESRKRYGAPKIQKVLESRGISTSLKRVQRHMAAMKLRSIVVKKYHPHSTKSNVEERENLLNRDFSTSGINQKWCTDITYIYTIKDGWTYLASVMDLHSKKIVGYAYSTSMTAELAVKAVENACLNVKDTAGIILHSDLGTQYTSKLLEDYLSGRQMNHSYSRKGNPYDNACIESFHSVLKKEEIHHNKYYDFKAAGKAIFEYIESWYNRKRVHSSLNYMSPQAFEDSISAAA
jgi:putative transposase